ncbi:YjcZ family sporulation protein [Ureibacillus sp. GCM10028918]
MGNSSNVGGVGDYCGDGNNGSYGNAFALLVVLFILLIIVGASFFYGGSY